MKQADEKSVVVKAWKLPGIFSLQHQVDDKQPLKMFQLQTHKEKVGSLTPSHPHYPS
jgi:hypothetical protein